MTPSTPTGVLRSLCPETESHTKINVLCLSRYVFVISKAISETYKGLTRLYRPHRMGVIGRL